jgi:ribosomal protein S18 acetylase RimI-like enzyme
MMEPAMMHPVRPALAADMTAILSLLPDTGLFTTEEADGFAAMIAAFFVGETPDHRWLVAGSRAAGAAYFGPEPMGPGVWSLWFLGVRHAARRAGLGRALVDAVEAEARAAGARLLMVETSSGDAYNAARKLYAAAGFDTEARIRDWYAPSEDKIVFRKALS